MDVLSTSCVCVYMLRKSVRHRCLACVWHDSIHVLRDAFFPTRVQDVFMYDISHAYVCHDSRMTWLIHMHDKTISYVWQYSSTCVTWLNHIYDMTHPMYNTPRLVWHDTLQNNPKISRKQHSTAQHITIPFLWYHRFYHRFFHNIFALPSRYHRFFHKIFDLPFKCNPKILDVKETWHRNENGYNDVMKEWNGALSNNPPTCTAVQI